MKSIKLIALLLLLGISQYSLAGNNAPVKVTLGERTSTWSGYDTTFRVVNITGLVDKLNVNRVVVNRGQCKESPNNPKNVYSLSFGQTQSYSYYLHSTASGSFNCDIIEIVVDTDKGQWTFSPNQ